MNASSAFTLIFTGLLGLIIGSFLNVVIYRVPAGIPLTRPSQCPHCDAPVKPWQNVPVVSWLLLRGKCANCKSPISARYPLIELATGAAFVAVTWWVLGAFRLASLAQRPEGLLAQRPESSLAEPAVWVILVAFLYLAAISIALTMIDLDTHRLPNAIVLPSYLVIGILFTLACLLGAGWDALLRAVIGGAAMFAFYWLLRLIRPGGMGGGDVKLAGVLGGALAFVGWGPLVVGAFAAFLLGGVFGIALMIAGRAGRTSAIPFGPWMILGAWIGLFTGGNLSRWYLGLLGVG